MASETERRAAAGVAPPLLEISYFTDPLCCWSWGIEPQLRRLRYGFAGRIAWRLRMGGMIADWEGFSDPLNSVHRPAQMGPLWMQAGTVTGMPVGAVIWVDDPPASSGPPSLAVKAAGVQSPAAADLYLRLVREAVMTGGRNIAREDVLVEIARELDRRRPDAFSAARFEGDLAGAEARTALSEDVREARFRGIGRFPCLMLRRPSADPGFLVGWRPWDALIEAVRGFAPDLGPERRASDSAAYETYWGGVTARELEVALGAEAAAPGNPVPAYSSGSTPERDAGR